MEVEQDSAEHKDLRLFSISLALPPTSSVTWACYSSPGSLSVLLYKMGRKVLSSQSQILWGSE